MNRFTRWIMCGFGWHSWFSPLPWHGSFATAWERCRWCGRERGKRMNLAEFERMLRRARRRRKR